MLLVVAAVIGGGLWLGWRWTQSKYYVGVTEDGTIAVFQGIPGDIAGFQLSTVDLLSSTKLAELTPVAQEKVKEGIPAPNQQAAREQMLANAQGIINMIQNSIEPSMWSVNGGPATVTFFEPGMALVVRAPAEMHYMMSNSMYGR